MMRGVIAVMLVVLSACGSPDGAEAAVGTSAVDSWYVRPTGACANNGDGLAYGCAASAGATGAFIGDGNIIWTSTVGVDDGDTLYVCGLHHHIDTGTVAAGSAAAPIIINFDCPGDPGIARATVAMSEALTPANWTNESANLWYLSLAAYPSWPNPRRVWVDGAERFPASVKAALGTKEGASYTPTATWWFDSGTNRLYLYSSDNPATVISSLESVVGLQGNCGWAALCFRANAVDFFRVVNPVLEGGNLGSLYVAASDNIEILGTGSGLCRIGSKTYRGALISDSSTAGTGDIASSVSILRCTIDSVIPPGFIGYNWQWLSGDGVHLAHGVSSSVIQNNIIRDFGHALIELVAVTGTTSVTDNIVSGNTLEYTTMEYGRCMVIDGAALGRASRNTYASNMCIGQPIRSQLNGDGNIVVGNVWMNQRKGTVLPTATQSLDMQGYAGPSQNNVVANNTFADNAYAPCVTFRAGAGTKSGNTIQNNILYNCGSPNASGVEQHVSMAIPSDASIGSQTIQNNIIYSPVTSSTVNYKGTGLTTVAGFQAACSGDVCTGNMSSNPQFHSIASYITAPLSPARGLGITYAGCIDVRGRNCNRSPDIGAYQSSSGDPASQRSSSTARSGSSQRSSAGLNRQVR